MESFLYVINRLTFFYLKIYLRKKKLGYQTLGILQGMVFNPVPFQSLEDPTQPPPAAKATVSQPKGFV